MKSRAPLVIVPLLLTAACAVGPQYVRPEGAARAAWAGKAPAAGASTSAAPASSGEAALARWWEGLGDPTLTALVERARARGLTVQAAAARLREARARRGGAAADLAPSVTASGQAARQGTRAASGGAWQAQSTWQAGLDASWELDLFGGKRRALEAAGATVEAAEADVRDAEVSLAAEVGLAYVSLRTGEARLALARRNLAALQETADLTRWRAEAGLTTALDAEQARANLEQERAAIPPLEAAIASDRNALAVLAGEEPGALDALLSAPGAVPAAARAVAVGVPASTLARRPDVRAAERRLAAQTAEVGVAVAARYPSLTLSGSIGLESLSAGRLVTGSLASGLLAPIFDAGRLARAVDAQEAALVQARVAYRSAVLTALQEVEDALVALDREEARRAALATAADAARQAASLAHDQYGAGLVAFTAVLDAERTVVTVEDALAKSDGDAASDLIRLYKALGGGWTPAGSQEST
ncbi:MAG: efflux transporter outer membrane subunit [Anaeromyxobacter sp.]